MEGAISSIVRQKKDRQRASIFVNGEFVFGVNEQTIEEFRLRKGDFIDELLRERIQEFDYWIDAKRIALGYLNFRARSEKEIHDRLTKENIPPHVIVKVLEFLKSYLMVNDEAWTRAFISDKLARKAISSTQLEHELKQKGIEKNIIAEAISELAESDFDRALKAGTKRWQRIIKSETEQRKQQTKLISFLAARGFSFDIAKRVYNTIASSDLEITTNF